MQNYISDAIAAANVGDVIYLEPGTYNEPALSIDKRVTIRGEGSFNGTSSVIVNCPGITVWAQGARIEGIDLRGGGSTADGVLIKSKCEVRDMKITGFTGNGVSVVSDARTSIQNGTPYENANMTVIERVQVWGANHGLYMDGGDVNVSMVVSFSAINCTGWGVFDSGFLGSTYIGCHVAKCGGAYKTDNPNARHLFVGCYAEGDTGPSELSWTSLVIGGLFGAQTGGMRIGDGRIGRFEVNTPGPVLRYGAYADDRFSVLPAGDHPHGISLAWWNAQAGTLEVRHGRQWPALAYTTNLTTLTDEAGAVIPGGNVVFRNGFWVPVGGGKHRHITPAMLMKLANLP